MATKKVSATMATSVALDTLSTAESLKSLRSAIGATSSAWKAQAEACRSAGDMQGSLKAKIDGLRDTIDLEQRKIDELKKKQEGLDVTTEKGAQTFLKYQKQIDQTSAVISRQNAQIDKSKQSLSYYDSGLAKLQKQYELNNKVSSAYVERLKTEGKQHQATAERIKQLRDNYQNLSEQYKVQTSELSKLGSKVGENDDQYKKQAARLEETAKKLKEVQNEERKLNSSWSADNTSLAKVSDSYDKVHKGVTKVGDSIKKAAGKVAMGATVAVGAVAGVSTGFVAASESAQKLQNSYKVTSNLLVTGGEKQAEVTKKVSEMQKQGRELSLKYGKSQQSIAEAYQDLVKRGDTSAQALGSMNSMVQASVASGDDLADVTQVTSNVMESFRMKVDSTGKQLTDTKEVTKRTKEAVNELAFAADKTSTNFQDLGIGMSYVGSTAKNAGFSLSETASAMGILSNNGLEADKAGTGLRKAINSLTSPTKDAVGALNSLGLSTKDFVDKSGKLKSMSDIFGLLNEKTKDMAKAKKADIFHSIFGTTGQQAGIILADNAKQLKGLNEEVAKSSKNNYIGKLANENMKTAQNSMNRFKMAAKDVGMTLATAVLPTVSNLAENFAKLANTKGFKSMIQTLGHGLEGVGNQLQKMFNYISKNSKAFSVMGKSVFKIIGAFGSGVWSAFKGIIEGIAKSINDMTGHTKHAKKGIDGVASALQSMAKHKRAIENLGKALVALWATRKMAKFVSGISNATHKIVDFATKTPMITSALSKIGSGFKFISKLLLGNPFGIAITAIVGIGAALTALYKHNAKFRHFVNGMIKDVKDWTGKTSKKISKWCHDFPSKVEHSYQKAKKKVADGWNHIKNSVSNGVKAVTDQNSKLHNEMISKISDATGVSKKTLNDGYKTMTDYTQTWKDLMTGKWSKLGGDLKNYTTDLSKTAKSIFSDMYNRLNDMTGGKLGELKDKWGKTWNHIVSGIKGAVRKVGNHAVDMVNDVLKPINNMIKGATDGINWVLDKFGASKIGKHTIPLVSHFATGGTVGKDGQLAMVNDSGTNNYREMFMTKDGQLGAFPKQRDYLTFLPQGTQILDGENSKLLAEALQIPHFKDGTKDKNLFEKIFDKGKDIIEDIGSVIAHPIKFLEKVFIKHIKAIGKGWSVGLIKKAPSYFAKQGLNWVKKLAENFKKSMESSGNYNGKGSPNSANGVMSRGDFAKVARQAAELMHQSLSDGDIDHLYHQAMIESTANPACGPGIDDHDGTGRPVGLFQYKLSTWASWAVKDHQNIHSALDQIMAVLNDSSWRSDLAPMNSRRGWGPTGHHMFANGGFVNGWTNAIIGEAGPEVVIPLSGEKQGRALDLLTRTVNHLNHNAGRNTQVTNTSDNAVLESKLDTMIGLLANILGVNQEQLNKQGNGIDLQGLYRKQYQDQAINNYQAF